MNILKVRCTSKREREREFYLTPDKPGCGHKADTAESSERGMSLCPLGRSMYRSGGDLSIYIANYIVSVLVQ